MVTLEKVIPLVGNPYFAIRKEGITVEIYTFNDDESEVYALNKAKELATKIRQGQKEIRTQIEF